MRKLTYLFIGILILVFAGIVAYFFTNSTTNYSDIIPGLIRTNTQPETTSNTGNAQEDKLTQSIDPFRFQDSSTPFKNTWIWENLYTARTGTDQDNLYQARVVRVINPLTEYEVELLQIGIHKILNITPATKMYMPAYTYEEEGTIAGVTFDNDVSQQEILTTIQKDSLLIIYVNDQNILSENGELGTIQAEWVSPAD